MGMWGYLPSASVLNDGASKLAGGMSRAAFVNEIGNTAVFKARVETFGLNKK